MNGYEFYKRLVISVKDIIRLLIAVALLSTLFSAAATSAAETHLAVIGSPDIQDSGVSDLLTVELSNIDWIKTVEREAVDRAIAELELSAVMNSSDVAKRLKLGKILRADLLLLLSGEINPKKPFSC